MSDTPQDPRPLDPRSLLVARPDPARAHQVPVGLPIVQSSTFEIDDALDAAMDAGDYRSQFLYTRYANPTVDALQRRLTALHGAEDGVCFASGMAAISSTFFALTSAGDAVVADTLLYGQTHTFLTEYLRDAGRSVTFAPFSDEDALGRALAQARAATGGGTVLAYAETLSNPLAIPLDLPRVAAQTRAAGATLLVDNTFANPLLCRPLEHGADVVIESLTKSIGGHSDVVGGAVLADAARAAKIWRTMLHLGGCIDPHAAFLVFRGLKTLALRTSASQSNARALASALRDTAGVTQVWYPDVSDAPWLDGSGAMLAFAIDGGNEAAHRVMDALQIVTPATSLGGVESLVSLPYNTSHRTPESRKNVGLVPGTVRLSVGCEAEADLIGDVRAAIARALSA